MKSNLLHVTINELTIPQDRVNAVTIYSFLLNSKNFLLKLDCAFCRLRNVTKISQKENLLAGKKIRGRFNTILTVFRAENGNG